MFKTTITLAFSILLAQYTLAAPIPESTSKLSVPNNSIVEGAPTTLPEFLQNACGDNSNLSCILAAQMNALSMINQSSQTLMQQVQANQALAMSLSNKSNRLQQELATTTDPKEVADLKQQIADLNQQTAEATNMNTQLQTKVQLITNNYSNMSNAVTAMIKMMKDKTSAIIQNIN